MFDLSKYLDFFKEETKKAEMRHQVQIAILKELELIRNLLEKIQNEKSN